MNNRQLTFAREYRGYTQTQLTAMVKGLSQSNLSKFEKGLNIMPEELLKRVMRALNFPVDFLAITINTPVEGYCKKKATIKTTIRAQIERFVSVVAYMVDWMSDDVEFPDFNFNYIDIESGFTPEEIARIIRRRFKLGVLPIKDIFSLLESNGVIIYQWDCNIKDFDGISVLTDKGYPLIVINRNISNDKKRYLLAKELGHIIMHQCLDFVISDHRDNEKEAHNFAFEFLLPELALRSHFGTLTFESLMENKKYWLTSMVCILKAAKKTGIIEETRYRNLMTEITKKGWRLNEPIPVIIDKPVAIEKAYQLLTEHLCYSNEDISKATKLPIDIIEQIFDYKKIAVLPL